MQCRLTALADPKGIASPICEMIKVENQGHGLE